jgi:PEP-CTERM motif-containing protein
VCGFSIDDLGWQPREHKKRKPELDLEVKMNRFLLTTSVLALAGAFSVQASTIAYNDPSGQGAQAFGGNLALNFDVFSPITVTALGVFNASGTGKIHGPIQVVIYDLVANTQVTDVVTFQGTYTPLASGFDVFQPISPVMLLPGSYQVDAVGFGESDLNGNLNTGSSTGPLLNDGGGLLNFTGASWDSSPTLDEPTTCAGCQPLPTQNSQFDAGTFEFAQVPEPATLLPFGCGLAGIAALRRRRPVR